MKSWALVYRNEILFPSLFDLTQLTNFDDDNFYLEWNTDLSKLITDLEQKLEMITKWLRDSGLLVNEGKTEVCLFHRNDQPKSLLCSRISELNQKSPLMELFSIANLTGVSM